MTPAHRRGYLDWLRGIAVLIMIEAHLFDSWTGGAARDTPAFAAAVFIGGYGAPLFLLLAGVSVALSAASKLRRTGSARAASRAVVLRGLEVFGLAFLFRIQAWILGWSAPWKLLTVDILNIMGPSIAVAGALWGLARSRATRLIAFAAATLGVALLTPVSRVAPIEALPDPIEAYIRPVGTLANFVIFPWAGYVFAGAFGGVILEGASPSAEGRVVARLSLAGLGIALIALTLSYLPSAHPSSWFWTSAPSDFFMRAGLLVAAIGAAYAWEARPGARKWSPVRQLGRTSLFIYWIHVEMVYGLISLPLHKALTIAEALAAYLAFTLFMIVCSLGKDRAVAWWRRDSAMQVQSA